MPETEAEEVELNIMYTEQNFIKTRTSLLLIVSIVDSASPGRRLPEGLVGSQNLLRVARSPDFLALRLDGSSF